MFAALAVAEKRSKISMFGPDTAIRTFSRGSGLFIAETGLATNHHFLLTAGGQPFNSRTGGMV